MGIQQLFRKILYPTDFSTASYEALSFVVKLSKMYGADLILLHTFRLTEEKDDNKKIIANKRAIESQARENFETLKKEVLTDESLHYSLLSEVGFFSDRILDNIEIHQIDLLVLNRSIQEKISDKSEKGCGYIIDRVPCPVMFVPEMH